MKTKHAVVFCILLAAFVLLNPIYTLNAEPKPINGSDVVNVPITINTEFATASYTVVFPADLTFVFTRDEANPDLASGTFEISIEEIKNLAGRSISVSVQVGQDGFVFKNQENQIPYVIEYNGSPLDDGGEPFENINEPTTMEFTVKVDPKDIKNRGSYEGSILFVFDVAE